MPWGLVKGRFIDSFGVVVPRYEARINEPVAGQFNDVAFSVTYTPISTGEVLRAGLAGGPAARSGVMVSINGGANYYDAATTPVVLGAAGVAVSILVRPYSLAYVGNDSEISTWSLIATRDGAPAWTDAVVVPPGGGGDGLFILGFP